MTIKNSAFGFIFLCIFSLTAVNVNAAAPNTTNANVNSMQAPPWQLTTQSGEIISRKQYLGGPVILHFWATWCPYCKKLQPKLVELEKKYQDAGVKIVAISFYEDEGAQPQDVIEQRGYNFITAVNGDKVAAQYGVRGTPTTFFIDAKGKVIFKSSSSDINDPKLEQAVKAIISK